MGYRARNGKWYPRKESREEYSRRKLGELGEQIGKSAKGIVEDTSNEIKDIITSADSPSDLFWGIAIAAVVWGLILF